LRATGSSTHFCTLGSSTMSGINVDKARFNVIRKKKIRRRIRQRAMLSPLLKSAGRRLSEAEAASKEKQA
jgi:hypothetical protein